MIDEFITEGLALNLRFGRCTIFETNRVANCGTELALHRTSVVIDEINRWKLTCISSLTRFATDMAATRRGWVQPTRP